MTCKSMKNESLMILNNGTPTNLYSGRYRKSKGSAKTELFSAYEVSQAGGNDDDVVVYCSLYSTSNSPSKVTKVFSMFC